MNDDRTKSENRGTNDGSRTLDVRLHLLDRQRRDINDRTIAVVDDVELSHIHSDEPLDPDAEAPTITHLLTGPVLATRISWEDVSDVDVAVELGVDGEELSVMWVEQWMRHHIVARIPGGRDDPQ